MANHLQQQKKVAVLAALSEGVSIRAIERMTGVHRDTIMRLTVRVGNGCRKFMHRTLTNLSCEYLQLDEIWAFVGKKQAKVTAADNPHDASNGRRRDHGDMDARHTAGSSTLL